jgi:hypothetical protein
MKPLKSLKILLYKIFPSRMSKGEGMINLKGKIG